MFYQTHTHLTINFDVLSPGTVHLHQLRQQNFFCVKKVLASEAKNTNLNKLKIKTAAAVYEKKVLVILISAFKNGEKVKIYLRLF